MLDIRALDGRRGGRIGRRKERPRERPERRRAQNAGISAPEVAVLRPLCSSDKSSPSGPIWPDPGKEREVKSLNEEKEGSKLIPTTDRQEANA